MISRVSFVLHGEDLGEVAIETVCPDVRAALRVDELAGNADAVADLRTLPSSRYRTPSSRPTCFTSTGLPLRQSSSCARYVQLGQLREIGDNVFADTVRKILLFEFSAHVVEGEDGNTRLVRWCRQWRCLGRWRGLVRYVQSVDAHGLDVLEALFAGIDEVGRDLALNLPPGVLGNRDAAGLGDAFDPRCDIDAVSKNIVTLDNNIANIDTDAEPNGIRFGPTGFGAPGAVSGFR